MIKTDLPYLENDLKEVVNIFENGENLDIKHLYSEKTDRVVNTIVVGGKSYAFGNYIGENNSDIVRKRLIKRYAKLSLYKALSAYLGISAPWGSLTGIRPTKLAYQSINETGEFHDFFTQTLKVSEEKTELVQKVLSSQKNYYIVDDSWTDFFVFIPFCPSRCGYCSFITSDLRSASKLVDKYVDTLIYEINASKKFIKNLRSIYVGGGTPVALSDEQLDRVLSALDDINCGVEYTVEAGRPDVITENKIAILKKHKVNRICVNPQTFNDKTLKLLNRKHTADEVKEKYNMVKDDFSVNMDLIAGLPEETFEDFKYSLDTAISLSPDDITVHTLCIKRGSDLSETVKRLPENETEKMVEYAYKKLTSRGYNPYYLYRQKYASANLENVGYAKSGKECVYNIDTMEEISSTVACGANAISKRIKGTEIVERYAAPKDVASYLNKIEVILENKEILFK